jgi:hypothetical protein
MIWTKQVNRLTSFWNFHYNPIPIGLFPVLYKPLPNYPDWPNLKIIDDAPKKTFKRFRTQPPPNPLARWTLINDSHFLASL